MEIIKTTFCKAMVSLLTHVNNKQEEKNFLTFLYIGDNAWDAPMAVLHTIHGIKA